MAVRTPPARLPCRAQAAVTPAGPPHKPRNQPASPGDTGFTDLYTFNPGDTKMESTVTLGNGDGTFPVPPDGSSGFSFAASISTSLLSPR